MSCDNFENICIFCQDIDVKNDDNSMNMIETSEHNQNELIDYKHCLNIKVHPKCLCIWFIKQENECLICRKKLDVSHNVLNDVNVNSMAVPILMQGKFTEIVGIFETADKPMKKQLLNTLASIDIANINRYKEKLE